MTCNNFSSSLSVCYAVDAVLRFYINMRTAAHYCPDAASASRLPHAAHVNIVLFLNYHFMKFLLLKKYIHRKY